MATYAIGDIQGCFLTFMKLLQTIAFNPKHDRLFLTGDLVNRGPRSLDVLRYVYEHQNSIVTVLGNHDIHLLAYASGDFIGNSKDLDPIIHAPDVDKLLDWLKTNPLMYREQDYILVHAGILPCWTIEQAEIEARKVEKILQSNDCKWLFERWCSKQIPKWHDNLIDDDKSVVALNAFTKIRVCENPFQVDVKYDALLEDAPKGFIPWFHYLSPMMKRYTFIFGHWAAMGLCIKPPIIALDSGCVWGRYLTAIRLEDGAIFWEKNREF